MINLLDLRAIPEKKTWGGKKALFFTPPSTELDFHKDQPPIDLEIFIYKLSIEFNLSKVQPPTELNFNKGPFW